MTKTETRKLTEAQIDFINGVVPWSKFVESQTKVKARQLRQLNSSGLSPILFICEVMVKSNLGSHPLVRDKYRNKPANNLTLLLAPDNWDGKVVSFNNRNYKAFDNWEEFCIHYSDRIVFSKQHDSLLVESNYLKQAEIYGLTKGSDICYDEIVKMMTLLGIKNE